MNTRMLKSGILLLLVSLLFAGLVVYMMNQAQYKKMSGNLVFENSYRNPLFINKIVIKSSQNEATLVLDDNFWKVKEADYYYANLILTNDLFMNINNSRFHTKLTYSDDLLKKVGLVNPNVANQSDYGKIITLYNQDNVVLNSFIIGRNSDNDLYTFIKPIDKDEIWLVTGKYSLPNQIYSWLQQPLLELDNDSISRITVNENGEEKSASRVNQYTSFFDENHNKTYVRLLTEELSYLSFEDAKSVQNFDESLYSYHKEIKVETFSGLIATLYMFSDKKDYWLKFSLSTTNLPTTNISDYIKDKSFLYDGWFFKLSPEKGRLLLSFNIR